MPVPAPGTAELLKGVPLRSSPVRTELTTPTGAAILTTLVDEWVEQPAMVIEHIGHGAGKREFIEQPNVLRLFVGTATPAGASPALTPIAGAERDTVWVLQTNLDDLPAEVIGYCQEQLFAAGALDVYTAPIFMKKNRPGTLLSVLAPASAIALIEEILFRETATFGIRRSAVERDKLHRRPHAVTTPWGEVQGKLGWLDGRPAVFTPEFEDCARIAQQHHIPLREVYKQAQLSYSENK
jgi:uncharacterized protein (DUF111 family)